jgi:hypothetical protein
MDTVRREIARRSDKDEHEGEKADTVLARQAVEYRHRRDKNVFLLIDERVAAEATRVAMKQQDNEIVDEARCVAPSGFPILLKYNSHL